MNSDACPAVTPARVSGAGDDDGGGDIIELLRQAIESQGQLMGRVVAEQARLAASQAALASEQLKVTRQQAAVADRSTEVLDKLELALDSMRATHAAVDRLRAEVLRLSP